MSIPTSHEVGMEFPANVQPPVPWYRACPGHPHLSRRPPSRSFCNAGLNGTTPGAAGYDQLRVIGEVFIGLAVLELHVGDLFDPPPLSTFTIIDNDGSDPISGTFAGLDEGATVTRRAGTASGSVMSAATATISCCRCFGENSYYLAEGATGAFFDNDVLIANPDADRRARDVDIPAGRRQHDRRDPARCRRNRA